MGSGVGGFSLGGALRLCRPQIQLPLRFGGGLSGLPRRNMQGYMLSASHHGTGRFLMEESPKNEEELLQKPPENLLFVGCHMPLPELTGHRENASPLDWGWEPPAAGTGAGTAGADHPHQGGGAGVGSSQYSSRGARAEVRRPKGKLLRWLRMRDEG